MDRMDALTPIVEAARSDENYDIAYMLNTGMYEFTPGFTYGVYSLLDGGDIHLRKAFKKKDMIYIALFHGPVSGCKLDSDYTFSDASTSLTTFNNFDFVMLGDIHKTQFLDDKKTIAYPGSLIQQNFGEDIDKGFLMWDIKSAEDFTCEFIKIENDYAYYTIEANDGILPDLTLPSKTRIRVVWAMKAKDISRSEATRLNSLIREKYNPLSVQLTFKPIGSQGIGEIDISDSSNLADPDVQRDLLKQWFDSIEEDIDVDQLMKIDTQITDVITTSEFEDFANSHWSLKKLTMENFMSYDESVVIDFEKMRGVIGLFGDNTAGKSVVIDAVLYALFNKTTREVKNEDLVNKNTNNEVCRVKLHLEIRGVDYELDRWTTRQYQKRSGRFINAKTDVTFKRRHIESSEWENLTETQRNETEKIIRNAIGSFDDFMITTLSTQGGSTEFMKLKRSPRADTMLRFLGLDVFSQKYDHAKDILKQIDQDRKHYNRDNEVETLDQQKITLNKLLKTLNKFDDDLEMSEKAVLSLRQDISQNTGMINKTISIKKDAKTLTKEKNTLEKTIETLKTSKKLLVEKITGLVEKMIDLEDNYIFDENKSIELFKKRQDADDIQAKIERANIEVSSHKRVLEVYRTDLLNENVCPTSDDERYLTCSFLTGYVEKKKECVDLIAKVSDLQGDIDVLQIKFDGIEYVYGVLDEQEKIQTYLQKAVEKLRDLRKDLVTHENNIEVKTLSLSLTLSQLKIAENNEDIILSNAKCAEISIDLEEKLRVQLGHASEVLLSRDTVNTKIILSEKEIDDIVITLAKIKQSDEQYKLFNTYCDAMHRDGLPADVLKGYIPKINYEINKILSDVVDFGVYLKIDTGETDIDIVMRYDGEGDDTRPVSMASGMEKLLINMAIRYALLSVSNLNTPSTWFIDEGFGVLDSENLYSMSQFFDNVKSTFKNIVIITHIDALKDVADWVIGIEKKDGISRVNSPIKNI